MEIESANKFQLLTMGAIKVHQKCHRGLFDDTNTKEYCSESITPLLTK